MRSKYSPKERTRQGAGNVYPDRGILLVICRSVPSIWGLQNIAPFIKPQLLVCVSGTFWWAQQTPSWCTSRLVSGLKEHGAAFRVNYWGAGYLSDRAHSVAVHISWEWKLIRSNISRLVGVGTAHEWSRKGTGDGGLAFIVWILVHPWAKQKLTTFTL